MTRVNSVMSNDSQIVDCLAFKGSNTSACFQDARYARCLNLVKAYN